MVWVYNINMGQETTEPSASNEFYFQWHITERCNRTCRHCYQTDSLCEELPLEKLLDVAAKMDEASAKWGRMGTVSLTGGEPYLRKVELYKLADCLDRLNHIQYYDILTNGSLIDKREAANLAGLRKLRRVQVSLEGAKKVTNDSIRGDGSFDSTLSAIKRLRSSDIEVSVMMTLTRRNMHEIADLIMLLGQEGVSALALERLIPEGNGLSMTDQMLSNDELKQLYEEVYRLATDNPPVRLLLYRPLFALVAPEDPTVGALCSAGNNALTIMPDGTVYPCRRLPIPIGNVVTDGFYKIWYGSELLWMLRDPRNLKGKCRDCDLLAQCRGCRAAAYFHAGDCMAEDPQCWK